MWFALSIYEYYKQFSSARQLFQKAARKRALAGNVLSAGARCVILQKFGSVHASRVRERLVYALVSENEHTVRDVFGDFGGIIC